MAKGAGCAYAEATQLTDEYLKMSFDFIYSAGRDTIFFLLPVQLQDRAIHENNKIAKLYSIKDAFNALQKHSEAHSWLF